MLFQLKHMPQMLGLTALVCMSCLTGLAAQDDVRNERVDTIVTRDGRVRKGNILAETWKNVTYQVAHGMAKPSDVVTKDIIKLNYFGMVSPGYYQRGMELRAKGEHERALMDFLALSGYLNADQRAEAAKEAAARAADPNNAEGGVVEQDNRKEWEKFYGTFEAGATMEILGRHLEAAEAFQFIGEQFPEHRLAASVWYRAGLNAALAGNEEWSGRAIAKLEPMTIERGERRVRSLTQAIRVASELSENKVDRALLAARQVRLSPDGDGVWQHWKTFWSGVLIKEKEYRDAVDQLQDMLNKSTTMTPSDRVKLQLKLAQAQMNYDPEAAALTCAAVDAAPGGVQSQREEAQLLLAQAWWQQSQALAAKSGRSIEEYRKNLIERVRNYAGVLKGSQNATVKEQAIDLELAVEAATAPPAEEAAEPET